MLHAPGAFRANASQSFEVNSANEYFFRHRRRRMTCESRQPTDAEVAREGDYAKAFWPKHFFDGTIDMSLQTNKHGGPRSSPSKAQRPS